jgi:hypothetical protein
MVTDPESPPWLKRIQSAFFGVYGSMRYPVNVAREVTLGFWRLNSGT